MIVHLTFTDGEEEFVKGVNDAYVSDDVLYLYNVQNIYGYVERETLGAYPLVNLKKWVKIKE